MTYSKITFFAEEIQTKPVVRNATTKNIHSPKIKKRRHVDDYEGKVTVSLIEDRFVTPFCKCFITNKWITVLGMMDYNKFI